MEYAPKNWLYINLALWSGGLLLLGYSASRVWPTGGDSAVNEARRPFTARFSDEEVRQLAALPFEEGPDAKIKRTFNDRNTLQQEVLTADSGRTTRIKIYGPSGALREFIQTKDKYTVDVMFRPNGTFFMRQDIGDSARRLEVKYDESGNRQ
jgi:hypothetical protein